jgi:hypothetical protein
VVERVRVSSGSSPVLEQPECFRAPVHLVDTDQALPFPLDVGQHRAGDLESGILREVSRGSGQLAVGQVNKPLDESASLELRDQRFLEA